MDAQALNAFIRQRIKRIRLERHLSVTKVAERSGMPISSYSSLETGAYHFTLSSLQNILAALNADITDVWPPCSDQRVAVATYGLRDLDRLNWFRLREIVVLSHAEAGALVCVVGKSVKLLGSISLTDEDWQSVRGLLVTVQERVEDAGWLILVRTGKNERLCLCLKHAEESTFLVQLARLYLCIWSASRDL